MWALICYAFVLTSEGITAWSYFEQVFERKGSRKVEIWMFILGYTLLFVLSQFKNVLVNTLAFLFVNLILLFSNFACKKLIGIIQVAFLTVVMGGTEVLAGNLMSCLSHDFKAYQYDISVMIPLSVLSCLLYFFVMQIIAKLIKPAKDGTDTSTVFLLSILPVVSVLITMTIAYISITTRIKPIVGILMAISVIALLMVNILVTVVYNHIQKMYNDRLELELIAQKAKMDTENYKILENQYENQRVLIHDIRGHMQVMRGLLESKNYDELENYLLDMERDPALQKIARLCDNTVLNVILVHHASICKSLGIDVDFDIRQHSVDFISAHDITAIFDNLLTNAEEAAKNTSEKYIKLSAMRQGETGMLITIINSCDSAPDMDEDGNIKTKKEDKEHHGVGLKSVRQAVQRYHGVSRMYYSNEENRFHSVIHLTK
ncbi:MAG: sensor histidine kinase [Oscillospiraceae bacterium]|jgi:two-component system sensor histidine kinase AgrC